MNRFAWLMVAGMTMVIGGLLWLLVVAVTTGSLSAWPMVVAMAGIVVASVADAMLP